MKRVGHIDSWVFDLDNTLYPATTDLFGQVDRLMAAYIQQLLAVDFHQARSVQKDYFRRYGTTLKGLMVEHDIDPHGYLDFVHDVDMSVLQSNQGLDAALTKLEGRKVIFTNASTDYALKVLDRLGIGHHFSGIFDIIDAEFMPKPAPETYVKMLAKFGLEPKCSLMIEDIARNLIPAARMGMTTAWLPTHNDWSAEGRDPQAVDYVIEDLTVWLEWAGQEKTSENEV